MKTETRGQKNGQINIILHDRQVNFEVKHTSKSNLHQFDYIKKELSSFIGLDHLKEKVKEIYALHHTNEQRISKGLKPSTQVLHMLFKGNPGTGKTTFARKLAKIYYELNILSKGHFIEAERADLVGEYIGQTAQKTRSIIQKALGGILFIDEAYSLARGGEKDFGREAIDTLVTHMENSHDDLVIILAGYPDEMEDFLLLNPGLTSRFPFIFDFEDFNMHQLIVIAKQMYKDREYELTREAEGKLKKHLFEKIQMKEPNFSNARYIRNIVEQSIRMQAVRIICHPQPSIEDLMMIKASDLEIGLSLK